MSSLKFAILSFLSVAAIAKEYPVGYWDKAYNTGESPSASFSISIQVPQLAKATMEIDNRVTKAGGSLTSMNAYDSGGRQTKSLTFSVDVRVAENLAKGLFDLGELQGYSTQRPRASKDADEIRDKLADLTKELNDNAASLSKMPIALHLLTARANNLKQALSAIESGNTKATIQVNLTEISKPKQ